MIEIIKEYLSNNFVGIIAGRNGYYLTKPERDTGVDFLVHYNQKDIISIGKSKTKVEYTLSSNTLHLQLKSTTEKNVKVKSGKIVYKLNAKNYRDLIRRKNELKNQKSTTPLFLILFILPEDESVWVEKLDDKLSISKHAYWYYPDVKEDIIGHMKSKTIYIPSENRLEFAFFEDMFKKFYGVTQS